MKILLDKFLPMSKPKASQKLKIPDEELYDLLTPSERRMLGNRYQIMNLLKEGLTIRKMAEKVKVGKDTVVRVAKMLESRPPKRTIKSATPWIFGKSQ